MSIPTIISIPSISNSFENANTVKESNAFRAVGQSISMPSTTSVSTPSIAVQPAGMTTRPLRPPTSGACPKCSSTNIDRDEGSGNAVCMACGTVIEENTIVSSVQFAEGSGGSSSIVGQYVAATATKSFTTGMSNRGITYSKESREITINNGRKRIAQLAAKLRLGQHYVDSAHRLFLLAVQRNFVQGRRTSHVVAACLHIVCRTEKSPYLLIDFSDALQVNVYELGTCFLKFCRLLNLSIPLIEPTLYIHRFSSKLEFGGGEKTHQVAMTALRLVKRFKKDWIQTGRRPAGICATALFLASGMHGFRRTQKDIISVTRIGAQTLRLRLKEFSETPTALLTPEEFAQVDLPDECDPPSFTKNRLLEAQQRQKMLENGNTLYLENVKGYNSGTMLQTNSLTGNVGDTAGTAPLPGQSKNTLLSLAMSGIHGNDSHSILVNDIGTSNSRTSDSKTNGGSADDVLTTPTVKRRNRIQLEREREFSEFYSEMAKEMQLWENEHGETLDKDDSREGATAANQVRRVHEPQPQSAATASTVPVPLNTHDHSAESKSNPAVDNELNDYGYDSEDDNDLESYLCNPMEVKQKTEIWNKINKSYLEEQAQKKSMTAMHPAYLPPPRSGRAGRKGKKRKQPTSDSNRAASKDTNGITDETALRLDNTDRRDKGRKADKRTSYKTAAEAAFHTMDRRKTKKIDYEAMQSLFQQNESTAHVASSGEN